MKIFFAFICALFINSCTYPMYLHIDEEISITLHKSRNSSKWKRIAVNANNNKSRKWAYLCEVCKKTVFDIVRHLRSHNQERPYTCSACYHTFIESSACSNHIQAKHSNDARAKIIINFINKTYQRLPSMKVDTTPDIENSAAQMPTEIEETDQPFAGINFEQILGNPPPPLLE